MALVSQGAVADSWPLPAPTGGDLGRQLAELHTFVLDRLQQSGAGRLAVLAVDVPGGVAQQKRIVRRAEGAAFAAAGQAGVEVAVWSDSALRGQAGPKTADGVRNLCATLNNVPTEDEFRRAAAAAVASLQRPEVTIPKGGG